MIFLRFWMAFSFVFLRWSRAVGLALGFWMVLGSSQVFWFSLGLAWVLFTLFFAFEKGEPAESREVGFPCLWDVLRSLLFSSSVSRAYRSPMKTKSVPRSHSK